MTYGNYPDWSKIRKILVVKMRHHGDVLLTSPLFSILKEHRPHVCIDALIYQETAPMLEGHPAIDRLLCYDRVWKKWPLWKRVGAELSLLREVRAGSYDLVFNLTEGDRGALVSLISGAPYRVGLDKERGSFLHRRYTHLVKSGPFPRHTVEKQLDALRVTGIFPEVEERELHLEISQEVRQKVTERLVKAGIAPKRYLLIHPTSRWQFKCLSVEQMGRVVQGLSERGYQIVLSAGPDAAERLMIDKILAAAPQVPVCNLAGELTLKELSALIAMAQGLLCVDSLPLHIASAVKTPVVALFGPTSELTWGPWRHEQSRVLTRPLSCRPCYKDGCGGSKMSDCLFSIPPSQIINAVDQLLAQS